MERRDGPSWPRAVREPWNGNQSGMAMSSSRSKPERGPNSSTAACSSGRSQETFSTATKSRSFTPATTRIPQSPPATARAPLTIGNSPGGWSAGTTCHLMMTVIAAGPHIATWVNGHQMTDWTDIREPNENPRQGLRLEPGGDSASSARPRYGHRVSPDSGGVTGIVRPGLDLGFGEQRKQPLAATFARPIERGLPIV